MFVNWYLNWLIPHMSVLVVVFMFITIGSLKTKWLYREACVDAASADQYVTFSPPCSSVFVYDLYFRLVCWHIIIRGSMEDGTVSSLSVGTSGKCRPCQWVWWHSVVSVSKDCDTVSFLSVGTSGKCRLCQWVWWHSVVSVSRDGGTVSFMRVGIMAQYRFCQ